MAEHAPEVEAGACGRRRRGGTRGEVAGAIALDRALLRLAEVNGERLAPGQVDLADEVVDALAGGHVREEPRLLEEILGDRIRAHADLAPERPADRELVAAEHAGAVARARRQQIVPGRVVRHAELPG